MDKAVEEMSKDQKDGSKEKPEEEMQKLEDEVGPFFSRYQVPC